MGKLVDLTGKTVGMWKVLEVVAAPEGKKGLFWLCECQCKAKTRRPVLAGNLHNALKGRTEGVSTNCGCVRKQTLHNVTFKHGESDNTKTGKKATGTYKSWQDMKTRCLNPNNIQFKDYGGRGIEICDRWLGEDGYLTFKGDLGERKKGESLERINVNGNYEPSNCKWIPKSEQNRNKRETLYWTHCGIRKPIITWAEEYGVEYHVLKSRLVKQRLKFEVAITRPVAARNVLYPFRGKMLTRRQIAEAAGVSPANFSAFSQRMHQNGNDAEDALKKPFTGSRW
jgi:hypothetical protein